MKKLLFVFMMSGLFIMISQTAFAQGFGVSSDFMSRYVWRGQDFGHSPSIQPTLNYSTAGGFEIGYWGAFSTTAIQYQEVDLYLSYTIKDVVSIGITDYFFPVGNPTTPETKYFEFDKDSTGHIMEANFSFNGTEKFPIYVSLNYNFYGADKDNSFYAELGYEGACKDYEYSVFTGFTTGKGIYLPDGSDEFAFVNLGLSVSKEIQITEKFALPVMSSLIINPKTENIFLVFGFSL